MSNTVEDILYYQLLLLHCISISLHCLGLFLLSAQIKKDRSHQVPIMMNLSVAEIFMSVFDVTYNVMTRENVDTNIRIYVYTVQCTCFVISCFLILTVLTLDRFFEVYLNLKYPIYFTKNVVRCCLAGCWCIGFSLGTTLCIVRYVYGINTLDVIYRVLFPLFEIIFFACAVMTYAYIYSKYRLLLHNPVGNNNGSEAFGKPKFFVPTLIIFTFFLFAIIPDQLHLFLFYIYKIGSDLVLSIILTLYVIGFICDAVIYIFFQRTTREILRKKVHQVFPFFNNTVHPSSDLATSRKASVMAPPTHHSIDRDEPSPMTQVTSLERNGDLPSPPQHKSYSRHLDVPSSLL